MIKPSAEDALKQWDEHLKHGRKEKLYTASPDVDCIIVRWSIDGFQYDQVPELQLKAGESMTVRCTASQIIAFAERPGETQRGWNGKRVCYSLGFIKVEE